MRRILYLPPIRKVALIIAAIIAIAPVCFAQNKPAAASTKQQKEALQAGRKLYERNGCYECHGHEGQGGSAGKRLAPQPIAYPDFAQYCRRPTGEMPPYSAKLLSEADLASIYAFLQSIPEPPPSKSIPILAAPAKKSGQ